MAPALPLPPPGFDDLSAEEKLDYVLALWDRITSTEPEIPVPEWHREVVEERLAEHEANPDDGEDWKVLRAELLRGFGEGATHR